MVIEGRRGGAETAMRPPVHGARKRRQTPYFGGDGGRGPPYPMTPARGRKTPFNRCRRGVTQDARRVTFRIHNLVEQVSCSWLRVLSDATPQTPREHRATCRQHAGSSFRCGSGGPLRGPLARPVGGTRTPCSSDRYDHVSHHGRDPINIPRRLVYMVLITSLLGMFLTS